MRFAIELARVRRHGFGAVHMRTGRSWLWRIETLLRNNGGLRESCALNHQYCDRGGGGQNNSLGLFHFLPSQWNWPLGREENRQRAQAANALERNARKAKQRRPSRAAHDPEATIAFTKGLSNHHEVAQGATQFGEAV